MLNIAIIFLDQHIILVYIFHCITFFAYRRSSTYVHSFYVFSILHFFFLEITVILGEKYRKRRSIRGEDFFLGNHRNFGKKN